MNELKEELNSLCGVSSERKSVMSPVTSEESGMVSHLIMDETIRQLRGSELRVSELRKRIEEVKKEKEKNESDSNNIEMLRKSCLEAKNEETKVLRRLYLLLKQLRNSLKSECLLRVVEVLCQKCSIEVTKEGVERLSPFNSEIIVQLLQEYLRFVVCKAKLKHSFCSSYLTCGSMFDFLIRQWLLYQKTSKTSLLKVTTFSSFISSFIGPYVFRVAKSMSKLDIREYLTKIYQVRVTRVNTANILGIGMNIDIIE